MADACREYSQVGSAISVRTPPLLLAELTEADLNAALKAAGKELSAEKARELLSSADNALQHYTVEHWCLAQKVRPSAIKVRLVQVLNWADKLRAADDCRKTIESRDRLLFVYRKDDAIGEATRREMRRAATRIKSADLVGSLTLAGCKDQTLTVRGAAGLSRIASEALAVHQWRAECEAAFKAETNTKDMARHKGDPAMRQLIGNLNSAWFEAFDEIPGVSRHPKTGEPCGPYLRFVRTLLHLYADKLSDAHICDNLKLSDWEISRRFRDTKISRLKKIW